MRAFAGIFAFMAVVIIGAIMIIQDQIKQRKNKKKNQQEVNV